MKKTYEFGGVSISRRALSILSIARNRDRGNVCPMNLKANAAMVVLYSLEKKGLIIDAEKSPFITDKGVLFVDNNPIEH